MERTCKSSLRRRDDDGTREASNVDPNARRRARGLQVAFAEDGGRRYAAGGRGGGGLASGAEIVIAAVVVIRDACVVAADNGKAA